VESSNVKLAYFGIMYAVKALYTT